MYLRKIFSAPALRSVAFASPKFCRNLPNFTVRRTAGTKGTTKRQNTEAEAAIKEDLEDVYELGCTRNDLQRMMDDDRITSFRKCETGTAAYQEYQRLASKFNIYLPDPLFEETIESERKKIFILEQIDTVEKYIHENKPKYIWDLYSAGGKVDECHRIFVKNTENAWFKALPNALNEAKQAAQNLDVDINEDLKQLENYYNFDTGWVNKIKKKLCKDTRADPQRSEIDPTRIITDEYWAISLVRLPDTIHYDHAFLVIEGKAGNKSMIWFADFVANEALNPGITDGKVRIDDHASEEVLDSSGKLLFRCEKKMMNIRNGDRLLHCTWAIPKPTAKLLLQNIQKQKVNPPKFNILGDSKLAASVATETTSHNCFSFSRMMLRGLKDEYIQIPQDTLDKWVYSAASRALVDK